MAGELVDRVGDLGRIGRDELRLRLPAGERGVPGDRGDRAGPALGALGGDVGGEQQPPGRSSRSPCRARRRPPGRAPGRSGTARASRTTRCRPTSPRRRPPGPRRRDRPSGATCRSRPRRRRRSSSRGRPRGHRRRPAAGAAPPPGRRTVPIGGRHGWNVASPRSRKTRIGRVWPRRSCGPAVLDVEALPRGVDGRLVEEDLAGPGDPLDPGGRRDRRPGQRPVERVVGRARRGDDLAGRDPDPDLERLARDAVGAGLAASRLADRQRAVGGPQGVVVVGPAASRTPRTPRRR